jgi:hypothetical protein
MREEFHVEDEAAECCDVGETRAPVGVVDMAFEDFRSYGASVPS